MKLDTTKPPELLPYQKLALLGIERESADKLPLEVQESLKKGEVTPLLQVSITANNGTIITLPLKLQMIGDRNGEPLLVAYPVKATFDEKRDNILRLTTDEADRLRRGDVVQKAVDINGEKTQQYLQLDPETKSVIHKRITEVQLEQKLKEMGKVNDIEFGTQQKQQIREGKPMELTVGGEKVTVGIDLKEPQGFKVVQGDMKEWERQQKIKYDELHPEYIGLVMTDKNRWEYQQVVDRQSVERAIKLGSSEKNERSNGLKI